MDKLNPNAPDKIELTEKQERAVVDALVLYRNLVDEDRKLFAQRKITNSSLPPKKQEFHNKILGNQLVKRKNAASAWHTAYAKLSLSEQQELQRRLKWQEH